MCDAIRHHFLVHEMENNHDGAKVAELRAEMMK